MIGLSVITNFDHDKVLFKIPNKEVVKSTDIDFEYLEFLIKKYKYSKLSVSGGTDPLGDIRKDVITIEIIRKIARDNNTRFQIYTKPNLLHKLNLINYLRPTKLNLCFSFSGMVDSCGSLVSIQDILGDVALASTFCPVRIHIDYNPLYHKDIKTIVRALRPISGLEYCVKQNNAFVENKHLFRGIYFIQKGDYNSYLMPDNSLYKDFKSKILFVTGYKLPAIDGT